MDNCWDKKSKKSSEKQNKTQIPEKSSNKVLLLCCFPPLVTGDALRPVHVRDRVHLLPGADRAGAPPAHPAPHRLVARRRTLLPGGRPDVAGGLLHLAALPVLQHPHQRPLPEHQPARQPFQVSNQAQTREGTQVGKRRD